MAIPAVPSPLNAVALSPFSVALDWFKPVDAITVEIDRALDAAGPWTNIGAFGDPPATVDTGLSELTTYFYRARACNVDGCSAYTSPPTEVMTPSSTRIPRFYRLRIRNASTETDPNGTADALVLSSVPTDTHPYLVAPPEGDGQEIDLLTGGVRTGAYTVRVVDAPLTSVVPIERVVTLELEDADDRQQLLSRRAYLEVSEDGTTWSALHAGYIVGLRLISAITYEFTVGDTRRVETVRQAFTWSEEPGPLGISERDVFPGRGCLLGGPIIGGFGPVNDLGGDEYTMTLAAETDTIFPSQVLVHLTCVAAYLPPDYGRSRNYEAIRRYLQTVLQPYREGFTQSVGVISAIIAATLDAEWVWFPKLTVEITDGSTTWTGILRAAATLSPPVLVALLDPASSVSPPSYPGTYRVRVYKAEVGDDAPIYIDQHPVDLVTNLFDTVGIEWDATTAAAVKDALNPDLRYALRITEPVGMLEFLTKSVFGPFGFSIRTNSAGVQEFYTTRLLSDAVPALTIGTDDLTDADLPIFALDEASVVSSFRVGYQSFARTTQPLSASPPPPPDGIVVAEHTVITQNADVSVFSSREIAYVFAGFVHLVSSWASRMGDLIGAITTLGLDRYGRGAPAMEVHVLANAAGYAAQLGDEVYLDVAHYPNRGYRVGESTVGARIAQVVRRTLTPSGARLRLVDSGLDLQPVTPVATISVAGSTGSPRSVAQFTITNAAAINATAALGVAVEWTVAASSPSTAGQVAVRYGPGEVPTAAVQLPPVAPGATVWVRARTEQRGRRPSTWTAWTSVTLTAFTAPSAVAISGITAESFDVAWTPGASTYWTEVFLAPGSVAPSDWSPYRVALLLPGSNRTVLRGLDASTTYIVGVCHRDLGTGERTTVATDSDTTTTNAATADPLLAFQVIPTEDDASEPSGIALGLWASDEGLDIEIERAPDSGGSPGTFVALARVVGTTQVFRDLLPNDGVTRWYRARHAFPGFDPSSYSASVSAVPSACPEGLVRPAVGPSLSLTVTPAATQTAIVITWRGTMTYTIDGGAPVAGTTSPQTINVARNAFGGAAKSYVFSVEEGGQITTDTVIVPPQEIAPTLAISACIATNAGAAGPPYNRLEVPFTYSGMPTGTVFDVAYNNGVAGGMDSDSGIAMATSPQSKTFNTVTFGGSPGSGAVSVVAKLNGQVIASAVRNKAYVT